VCGDVSMLEKQVNGNILYVCGDVSLLVTVSIWLQTVCVWGCKFVSNCKYSATYCICVAILVC